MNSEYLLLDTNIIIYALQEDPVIYSFVDRNKAAVSFVTEIELLGWDKLDTSHLKLVREFLNNCLYLNYSFQVENATIGIKQKFNLKLGDAFIAATSLHYDIPLVSADRIFSKVENLNFIHISPSLK